MPPKLLDDHVRFRLDLAEPEVTGVVLQCDRAVPGSEEDKQRALEGLKSAAGFFRSKLAKALTTRVVPELHFDLDRGLEHAARINELLEQVRRESPPAEEPS